MNLPANLPATDLQKTNAESGETLMARKINVVVSQGQSAHPAKRQLEEELVAALLVEPGVDVTVIPHLYDLEPEGTGILALSGISADMVVVSWLYSRAAHWVLARNAISGRLGRTLLVAEMDESRDALESDDLENAEAGDAEDARHALAGQSDNAASADGRTIYHLDFRVSSRVEDFVNEIRRIVAEVSVETVDLLGWIGGTPKPEQMKRYLAAAPKPDNAAAAPRPALTEGHRAGGNGTGGNGASGNGASGNGTQQPGDGGNAAAKNGEGRLLRVEESTARRWYPVIDFTRCTNCMECIDFCLFGVYGVDAAETILVEQPDNCRKGCPACSRVCPENAIIFPQHKSPAIAGSSLVESGDFKIDLSKLFGAQQGIGTAVEERDRELLAAGRDAVGMEVGIPKRQQGRPASDQDELDALIDELDEMDL